MSGILNVLYQSDDGYAPVLGVSLTSLFESNKDIGSINVYVLNDDIGDENLAKIRRLCDMYGRSVVFAGTGDIVKMLRELNVTTWHGGYTAWLKVFSLGLLDLPTDRVLYIDCDTLVTGSLAPLIDFELDGNIMAMTYDCMLAEYKENLGIKSGEGYYNVGVILFDKEAWTREGCEERIIEHIKCNRYYLPEQDVVNVLFRRRVKYLDCRYNFFSYYILYGIEETLDVFGPDGGNHVSAAEIAEAARGPVIHHMIGAPTGRPWEKGNRHPLRALFDKYLAMSPWHDFERVAVKRGFMFSVQRFLYSFLPRGMYMRFHKYGVERHLKRKMKDGQV